MITLQENVLDDVDIEEEQTDGFPKLADESLFSNSLALFHLKRQAKLLLPSSVIQTIIEDLKDLNDVSQSHLFYKLKEKLVTLGLSEGDISNIVGVLKSEDLFWSCNTDTLKTDKRRKLVFESQFRYLEPVPICLGQNES